MSPPSRRPTSRKPSTAGAVLAEPKRAAAAGLAPRPRAIWPDIDPSRLQPGYAGVRPKLSGPGEPAADFLISGPAEHRLAGLVNLFGIESPGLTASLALADEVARRLDG